jgi:hypothetical protein
MQGCGTAENEPDGESETLERKRRGRKPGDREGAEGEGARGDDDSGESRTDRGWKGRRGRKAEKEQQQPESSEMRSSMRACDPPASFDRSSLLLQRERAPNCARSHSSLLLRARQG